MSDSREVELTDWPRTVMNSLLLKNGSWLIDINGLIFTFDEKNKKQHIH